MTVRDVCEICVVGGGPAGAVAAWKLARLGHGVLVVERAVFPRPHVGEALSPGVWPQLDLLGLTETVCAAGFRPTRTALVRWAGPTETVRHPDPPGLMVDRGRFDRILLRHAEEAGARILQPAFALKPRREDGGWIVPVRAPEGGREIRTRFLVDASGRAARLEGRKEQTGASMLALHGTWASNGGWGEETRTEAGDDGWLWAAARPDGCLSAMAFLDPERYRAARAAGATREAFYRDRLARSHLLAEAAHSTLTGSVGVCDATCRHATEPVGDGFLRIGEAAYTLDPLSSTGVQKAMQTGWTGAIAVHTVLTRPQDATAARRFYAESHQSTITRHADWAARLHARTTSNGEDRTVSPPSGTPLRLSPAASLIETPCITGDHIEMRRALVHPGLERPVAYLDGVEIAPLVDRAAGLTLDELAAVSSPRLAAWLVRQGIFL